MFESSALSGARATGDSAHPPRRDGPGRASSSESSEVSQGRPAPESAAGFKATFDESMRPVVDRAHRLKEEFYRDNFRLPDRFLVSDMCFVALTNAFERWFEEQQIEIDPALPVTLWGVPLEIGDDVAGTEIVAE